MKKDNQIIFDSFVVKRKIAHRGLYDENNPENSLGAIQKAIEKGYNIEIETRLLADGTVVVFHDKKLARMTGVDGYINSINADELANIKLLKTDFGIPTLQQVLDLVKGQTGILVKIVNKSTKVGKLESAVLDIIKNYEGEIAIVSFDPYSLEWFAKNAPQYQRGILSFNYKDDCRKLSFLTKFVLRRMMLNNIAKPNFICYRAKDLPCRYVKKYKELPLIAWGVSSQKEYHDIIKQVDNIIVDGFEPQL